MKLKDLRDLSEALKDVVAEAWANGKKDDDEIDVLETIKAIGEQASAELEVAIAAARGS